MLDKEYSFFKENQKSLFEKYANRVVAIVGSKVVGNYKDYREAYLDCIDRFEEGSFLLQLCGADESVYTTTFHSRASF